MNRQQAFDTAVRALIAQGKPSYDRRDSVCLYRGPNGTKCAIGHLIPDEKYSDEIEGETASHVLDRTGIRHVGSNPEFADALQSAHDDPASIGLCGKRWLAKFRDRAREVGNRYGLETSVLDETKADA